MSAVGVNARFESLRAWFDTLALRERVLLTVTVLAVIWMIWLLALQRTVEAQRVQTANSISSVQAQLQAAVIEQRMLSTGDHSDPNAELNHRRDALLHSIASLEDRLQQAVESFVAPDKVPQMLAEIMREHPGLTFSGVTRLPTEPLVAGADPAAESTGVPRLYRHPIRINFEGGYFAVLRYLLALESSGWRLNWRRLDYEVAQYPVARVSIEVDTLSRSRDWLGV